METLIHTFFETICYLYHNDKWRVLLAEMTSFLSLDFRRLFVETIMWCCPFCRKEMHTFLSLLLWYEGLESVLKYATVSRNGKCMKSLHSMPWPTLISKTNHPQLVTSVIQSVSKWSHFLKFSFQKLRLQLLSCIWLIHFWFWICNTLFFPPKKKTFLWDTFC